MAEPFGPGRTLPRMVDLVAHWRSARFLEEVTGWVDDVLAARRQVRTGPLTEVGVRFWAAVYAVPLPGGRAFLKVANPGQAFEGPLLDVLARLAPGHVVPPWAVDSGQGRWLLPDGGPLVPADESGWARLVRDTAVLQRRCEHRRAELDLVPALDASVALDWAARTVEDLAALPEDDAQHLRPDAADRCRAGLVPLAGSLRVLAGSGVPDTLQPNDMHPSNACDTVGTQSPARLFDLGDAFWSHPWAVLHRALRGAGGGRLAGPLPHTPLTRQLVSDYTAHWPQVAPQDRAAVVAAADRLGALQRAASWQRLLAHVDPDRLSVPAPRVADYLAQALRPDAGAEPQP